MTHLPAGCDAGCNLSAGSLADEGADPSPFAEGDWFLEVCSWQLLVMALLLSTTKYLP